MVRANETYEGEFDDGQVVVEITSAIGVEIECEVVEDTTGRYTEGEVLSLTQAEMRDFSRLAMA